MGNWSTAIKDSDAFSDVYGDFFELYNNGENPKEITEKILSENFEILEIDSEKNDFWFAIALAQWETKTLDEKILKKVENIINSGDDIKLWAELGADKQSLTKRKIALEKFLIKLKSDREKPKPRKKEKLKTPVFKKGDCFIFLLENGNYGGSIVLAEDNNPKTAYNLIATTRLNLKTKPTKENFINSEVLICNYGNWNDSPKIVWYAPDLFKKKYSELYEYACNISIEINYDINNYSGEGYLFKPSSTAGWNMKSDVDNQFKSEISKTKPKKIITIKQLTKRKKWWDIF